METHGDAMKPQGTIATISTDPLTNGTARSQQGVTRGPQWPGHRTFLSILKEEDLKPRTGSTTSSEVTEDSRGGNAWLWMVAWINCFMIMGMSLQGASFTGLAIDHGLTSLETGATYCCSKASVVIGALLAKLLMSVVYPTYLLVCGMILHGSSIAALGALYWLPRDPTLFLAVGATIKSVAGIGFALYFTTMYTILFYKHQTAFVAPLIMSEVAVGIGGVIGPIIGFELIQVWQYPLPYFAVGGCMLLGILVAVALPLDACVPHEKAARVKAFRVTIFLLDIRFWVDVITAALSGATIAHFETVLYPHLTSMAVSSYHINYSFSIVYGAYAIGALLFGITAFKFDAEYLTVFVAQLLCFIAFLFVGPATFLSIPAQLWLTRLGIGLAGCATAGQFIPVLAGVVHSSTWRSQISDLWTISTAVAIVVAAVQVGGLASSLFSGFVMDNNGSVAATTVMLTIHGSWCLVRFLVWITDKMMKRNS